MRVLCCFLCLSFKKNYYFFLLMAYSSLLNKYSFTFFSFSIQQCIDIFGSKFNTDLIQRGIRRTNTNYGALGIKITKVVFPNGSIDPWHALGVIKDLGPDARAIYINGKCLILDKNVLSTY